jgi:hypothetical protein
MKQITLTDLSALIKQLPDPKTYKWKSINIGDVRFHEKDGLWMLNNPLAIDDAARTAK